ncbi:MAG: hypothetical protein GVY02_08395, partial [Bacteroidetes bacterium]|nr:hypothetical protein [Bacteroidota bacterium]
MRENESDNWDEYRWEEFLRESDKRTQKYIELLDKYKDHPDSDGIIAKEMGWGHLIDDEVDQKERWMDELLSVEYEEGEDWKRLTGYEPTDCKRFEDLPLYKIALELAIEAQKIFENSVTDQDDESVQTFLRFVTIPPAKIAGGFGFGFEQDSIGGNIANCKRGLQAANRMLDALYE